MKTKQSFILAAVLIFFGVQGINAQTGPTNSDRVTLNIKLNPIQTLIVNGEKKVNLEYTSTTDYSQGVKIDKSNHLTAYSTGGFEIKAKSNEENLTGKSANIPLDDITITPKAGDNPFVNTTTYTAINLSKTEQVIVSNTTGGVNKTVSINYAAKGNDEYVNLYKSSENPTVFTTTITYSIVAK